MNCTGKTCNCNGCVALRICQALDLSGHLTNRVYAPLVTHSSSNPEVLMRAMVVSLDQQLHKIIENAIKNNQEPESKLVDAKEWTEWHLESWSRNGEPEPIPAWAQGEQS